MDAVAEITTFALQSLGGTAASVLLGATPDELDLSAADPSIAPLVGPGSGGPVADAFATASAVIIADLHDEHRWPGWPDAAQHELRSLLLVRIRIGERPNGVLLVGHSTPEAFCHEDDAIAQIIARHAAIVLAGARHQATLVEAVDARKLVGQAMGILMERYAVDADRAFAILRRYSQDTNTKLRTIALRLIEERTLPGLDQVRGGVRPRDAQD